MFNGGRGGGGGGWCRVKCECKPFEELFEVVFQLEFGHYKEMGGRYISLNQALSRSVLMQKKKTEALLFSVILVLYSSINQIRWKLESLRTMETFLFGNMGPN